VNVHLFSREKVVDQPAKTEPEESSSDVMYVEEVSPEVSHYEWVVETLVIPFKETPDE
jgi:hypothetical protein